MLPIAVVGMMMTIGSLTLWRASCVLVTPVARNRDTLRACISVMIFLLTRSRLRDLESKKSKERKMLRDHFLLVHTAWVKKSWEVADNSWQLRTFFWKQFSVLRDRSQVLLCLPLQQLTMLHAHSIGFFECQLNGIPQVGCSCMVSLKIPGEFLCFPLNWSVHPANNWLMAISSHRNESRACNLCSAGKEVGWKMTADSLVTRRSGQAWDGHDVCHLLCLRDSWCWGSPGSWELGVNQQLAVLTPSNLELLIHLIL